MRTRRPTSAISTLAILALVGASVAGTARAQSTTSTTSTTVSGSSTSTSTSTTTIPPVLRCKNRLLNRSKKLVRGLARCGVLAVKRAKKLKPFDEAACIAARTERYDRTTLGSTTFGKGCLQCTVDAVPSVRDDLLGIAADVDPKIECAPEVPLAERATCEIKLRKALAGYQAALMTCRKEAALLAFRGGVPAESSCAASARARFDARFARLSCPACIDGNRLAGSVFESTDDVITAAQCPCRFGDDAACSECRDCDLSNGCVAANEGQSCGRDGCTEQTCVGGTCTLGQTVGCSDGDVCTVDVCLEAEDPSCHGADCCSHEPLCDPATLGACVLECSCDATVGCSCRCTPGCAYAGCVIFSAP